MTDIKFLLDQELSSLNFKATAEDIKAIYLKRKHKAMTIYTTCTVTLAAAFIILFLANAPAVSSFMNSIKNNFGSFYSQQGKTKSIVDKPTTTAAISASKSLNPTSSEKKKTNHAQSVTEIKDKKARNKSIILSKNNSVPAETESKEKSVVNDKEYYSDYSYSVLSDKTLKITGLKNTAKTITIPKTIDGKDITVIGNKAFEKSSVKKVTLPDTVTTIESYAFCEATSLEEISLSKNLKNIGNYAFEKCASLKEINLKNVEYIGIMAFYKCNALSALTVPSGVKEIGTRAFSTCKSIKTIELNCDYKANAPYNEYARTFENCTSLQKLKIGDKVTNISEKAFSGCTALSEIIFPDTLKNILDYAFEKCSSLKELTVPKSVEDVGYMAFIGCKSLIKAKILGDNTTLNGYSLGFYEDKYKNPKRIDDLTIYCNKGSKAESYAKYNKFQTVTGG